MKRLIWIVCCALLILLLCSCGKKQPEMQVPANFYYVNTDVSYNSSSGVIQSELREAVDFQGDLATFIRTYLRGPVSGNLQTYIPYDVKLVSCDLLDGVANLTFSEEYAKLTGTRLSVSCSALLMSIHDFSGVDAIRIQVENSKLEDNDEIYMTMDDIILLDPVQMNEK